MAKKRKQDQGKLQQSSKVVPRTREIKLPLFVNKHFTLLLFGFYLILSVVFLGSSLLPSSMLFGTDFLAGDLMTRKFIAETHGVPFWQPYVFGGVPFVDAVPGDLFYPVSFLIRILKIIPYYSEPPWLYLIHFPLAGLFIYLLLIELGLGKLPSVISGISYMFTGQIVSLIYAGHVGKIIVCCLLPGLFWLIHRGVRLRRLREFVLAGGLLGCVFLSPQIQIAYYSLLATVIFWIVLVLREWKVKIKKTLIFKDVIAFVTFIILGFMLAAILYIPFFSYIPFSPRAGREGRGIEFAKSWSMPPEETVDAIIPDFSGMSIGNTSYDTYWGQNVFKLHSEYIGVLPLLLTVLGIALFWKEKDKRSYLLFFIGLLTFGLLFAWGAYTPFFSLFYTVLPYYKKLRASGMAFFLVSFATACLAGFGAEAMLKRRDGEITPGRNKRLMVGLGIAGGAGMLLGLIVSGAREGFISFLGNQFVHESQKYQQLQVNYDHFVSGTFLFALFLILQIVLLVLMVRRNLPKTWWAGLAIGLLILDLWRIDFRFRQIIPPPEQSFVADEVVRVLKQDASFYRVWPLEHDKMGNYLMIFGIQNILGEHGNQLKRYNEFVGPGKTRMVDMHNLQDKPNFLNLLNVKYLITYHRAEEFAQQAKFVFPRLKLISDGTFKVYENLDVLPRAFCVQRYEVIRDPKGILNRIGQADFNPGGVTILEEDPGLSLAPQDSGRAKVSIANYAPNEVRMLTDASGPSLLVFCENYYPSWKAYVDGRPSKLYRADYTFRAVSLPAGRHEVIFRFESKQFRQGAMVSLLALLTLAAVAVTSLVKGKSPA
jgi:hypothetical protein